jgi:hypothetical protein
VLKPIDFGFEGGIDFPIKNVEVKVCLKHSIGNMYAVLDIPPNDIVLICPTLTVWHLNSNIIYVYSKSP